MAWVPRSSFTSEIPEGYAAKDDIEGACRAWLEELGRGWQISIVCDRHRRGPSRGRWTVSVAVRLSDGRRVQRTWHTGPDADSIKRRLRATIEGIRRESETRFGMMPVRPLDDATRQVLDDWVRGHGGEVADDGWVWLPDQPRWNSFLALAQEHGAEYAVEIR
jgi:hypothetical protein